jgi:hypothetical protein
MNLRTRMRWLALGFGLMLCAGAVPAYAVQAGVTLDVHQDITVQTLLPNDFHIEGYICSHVGLPTLVSHLDDIFPNFQYTMTKVNPSDPDDCWYWFEATWWFTPGTGYIPFCTVLHLGVLFDVDAANVIIDLIGWWTRNGQPVGGIIGGNLQNHGYVPVIGFNVADTGGPQVVTVGNGLLPPTAPVPPLPLPQPPVPPPWPPADLQLWIHQLDVIPFPAGMAPNFNELRVGGAQESWPWVPVTNNGVPIENQPPLYMAPDSFFDIFLESVIPPVGTGNLGVLNPFSIEPGGFLVARQLVGFYNNSTREYEQRWFWEIHGAQANEACCFQNGTCQNLPAFTCRQLGGTPQGAGTLCLGDLNGNQIDDACEPEPELGACCYGTAAPMCIVTDQVTCTQTYLGVWKGLGTTCADLDGDGVADICEHAAVPEACCLPDGTCQMLPPDACLQLGGVPKGVGSHCLGDLDANGTDDICETKWLQPPDLNPTGIDVFDSDPFILADDFLCTKHSLITDIIVWGSWKNDILPSDGAGNVEFTLSLHADVPDPDGTGPLYSHPGDVLWFRNFVPGQFTVQNYQGGINEGWMVPPQQYLFPGDHTCWMYRFQVPAAEAFCQKGSPQSPIVYWLDVQARPLAGPTIAQFGWKTSTQHWNDDAVWGNGVEPYPGPWNELTYPPEHQLAGQSIDLAFALSGDQPCEELDFGDAPDPLYPTLRASNGARHVIVPGVFLGQGVDAEPDGQPNANATGDDLAGWNDEDGVVFATSLKQGQPAIVKVTASVAGSLFAWVDFNANGSWADAGEQIFSGPVVAGVNTLNFIVPTNAVLGNTFARFRFTTVAGALLSYDGPAVDGEVEDYFVTILDGIPPTLTAAESRATHGAAGTFAVAINLTATGTNVANESRVFATTLPQTIRITFSEPVQAPGVGAVSIYRCTTGTTVVPTNVVMFGTSAWDVTLNGAGVNAPLPDVDHYRVTVAGVKDIANNALTGDANFEFRLLGGNPTVSPPVTKWLVNGNDVSQTQARLGQPLTPLNFMYDVLRAPPVTNGVINGNDVSGVQARNGHTIACTPP